MKPETRDRVKKLAKLVITKDIETKNLSDKGKRIIRKNLHVLSFEFWLKKKVTKKTDRIYRSSFDQAVNIWKLSYNLLNCDMCKLKKATEKCKDCKLVITCTSCVSTELKNHHCCKEMQKLNRNLTKLKRVIYKDMLYDNALKS